MSNHDFSAQDIQPRALITALCVIVMVASASMAGSIIWGRGMTGKSLLLIVVFAGIGAVLGRVLGGTTKGRVTAVSVCLVLAIFINTGARYSTTDAWLLNSPWPEHTIGHTSFSYPAKFAQKKLPDSFIPNGTVRVFTNENTKRYASYMIYDFTGQFPSLEDSLSGSITAMLNGIGAVFEEWDDSAEMTTKAIRARFTYTLRNTSYTGLAFAYAEGAHYELLAFYPLRAAYPEAFLERISNSICVDGRPPFKTERSKSET